MSPIQRFPGVSSLVIGAGLLVGLASTGRATTFVGDPSVSNGWDATSAITATASSVHYVGGYDPAVATVDGNNNLANETAKFDSTGTLVGPPTSASTYHGSLWLSGDVSGEGPADPATGNASFNSWIEWSFNASYQLSNMLIWNGNNNVEDGGGGNYDFQDVQDVTIQYSNDGVHWTTAFTGAIPEAVDNGSPNYQIPVSLDLALNGISAEDVVMTVAPTDWNYDSNTADANVVLSAVMFQVAVPEPSSIGLLALGGLAVLRRRRRARA